MGDEILALCMIITFCVTGTVITSAVVFKDAIAERLRGRAPGLDRELVGEMKALREELARLRQQNNDLMLGVDTTLESVNRRLAHLESQGRLGTGAAAHEQEAQLGARSR
jgi:hypothetical protein